MRPVAGAEVGTQRGDREETGQGGGGQENRHLSVLVPGKEMNGLPWWLSGKESARTVRDPGSLPGSERAHGEGNGNPLQNSP